MLILPSAFYHPHFFIRNFPSAFYHPQFSIRHPPSAIRHLVRTLQRPLLQVLQILHILSFTDVNSETETHLFLNSTSEYMNQKRQVLRELISHDILSNLVQSQWK